MTRDEAAGLARYGLIGDPVDHSLSPVMHNAAFAALDMSATYDLLPTLLSGLRDRLAQIRSGMLMGANVTVPHKEAVLPLCDEVSDTARRAGAVNTLVMSDGRLFGDSTDGFGFLQSLTEHGGWSPPERALIVGAGGASRAVIVALREAGVAQVVVNNRTADRAVSLVADLRIAGVDDVVATTEDELERHARESHLLVNATSIGWHGDDLPVGTEVLRALPESAMVADLTYRETPLLRAAARRGLRVVDGLGMLLHQGVRSFEIWTGVQPPVEVMRDAIQDEQRRGAAHD